MRGINLIMLGLVGLYVCAVDGLSLTMPLQAASTTSEQPDVSRQSSPGSDSGGSNRGGSRRHKSSRSGKDKPRRSKDRSRRRTMREEGLAAAVAIPSVENGGTGLSSYGIPSGDSTSSDERKRQEERRAARQRNRERSGDSPKDRSGEALLVVKRALPEDLARVPQMENGGYGDDIIPRLDEIPADDGRSSIMELTGGVRDAVAGQQAYGPKDGRTIKLLQDENGEFSEIRTAIITHGPHPEGEDWVGVDATLPENKVNQQARYKVRGFKQAVMALPRKVAENFVEVYKKSYWDIKGHDPQLGQTQEELRIQREETRIIKVIFASLLIMAFYLPSLFMVIPATIPVPALILTMLWILGHSMRIDPVMKQIFNRWYLDYQTHDDRPVRCNCNAIFCEHTVGSLVENTHYNWLQAVWGIEENKPSLCRQIVGRVASLESPMYLAQRDVNTPLAWKDWVTKYFEAPVLLSKLVNSLYTITFRAPLMDLSTLTITGMVWPFLLLMMFTQSTLESFCYRSMVAAKAGQNNWAATVMSWILAVLGRVLSVFLNYSANGGPAAKIQEKLQEEKDLIHAHMRISRTWGQYFRQVKRLTRNRGKQLKHSSYSMARNAMVSSASVPISLVQTFWRTFLEKMKIEPTKMFRTMGRGADQLLMLTVIEMYIWPFFVAIVALIWNTIFSWTPQSLIGMDNPDSTINQVYDWAMNSFWLSWIMFLVPLFLILTLQDFIFERIPRWNDIHMQPRKESIKAKIGRILGYIVVAGHDNVVAWEGQPEHITDYTTRQFRNEVQEDNLVVAGVTVDTHHFQNPISDAERSSRFTKAFEARVGALTLVQQHRQHGWKENYSREYIQLHQEVNDYYNRMAMELRRQERIVKERVTSQDWTLSREASRQRNRIAKRVMEAENIIQQMVHLPQPEGAVIRQVAREEAAASGGEMTDPVRQVDDHVPPEQHRSDSDDVSEDGDPYIRSRILDGAPPPEAGGGELRQRTAGQRGLSVSEFDSAADAQDTDEGEGKNALRFPTRRRRSRQFSPPSAFPDQHGDVAGKLDWQSVDATEPQKIQQWDEVLGVAGESGGNNLEDEFDSPEPFNLDTPSSTEGRDPDALVI